MPEYTKEELIALYQGLKCASKPGTSIVIGYLRALLLLPYIVNTIECPEYDEIDCTDNLREKLIHRSKNTVFHADDTKISNIFGNGKQIRIATFLKKLLFNVPLKRLPLYINKFSPVDIVVAWRLKIGK